MVNITVELQNHAQKLHHMAARCAPRIWLSYMHSTSSSLTFALLSSPMHFRCEYASKTPRRDLFLDEKMGRDGQVMKRMGDDESMENMASLLKALATTIELEDTAPKLLGVPATPAGFRFAIGYIGSSVTAIVLMLAFGQG